MHLVKSNLDGCGPRGGPLVHNLYHDYMETVYGFPFSKELTDNYSALGLLFESKICNNNNNNNNNNKRT